MEEHLKRGFIFAVVCAAVLLFLNMMAWTGVEWAKIVSGVVLAPLSWFWDLLGISGCQAMGHIVFIFLSIPVYYLIVGFFVGFLYSLLIETIFAIKEAKRYPKQSPKDLNNGSPGCSETEPGD